MASRKTATKAPKKASKASAKPKDTAVVQPPPPRAVVLFGDMGDPRNVDTTNIVEITLSNVGGFYEMLRTLGRKTCFVTLFMRGKVHEMTRKYHPTEGDVNPYYDPEKGVYHLVKYSIRAGWVNLRAQDALDRFLTKRGEEPRELEQHPYAVVDQVCSCVRRHEKTDQPYLAFFTNEGFLYREVMFDTYTGEIVTRADIEPYCGGKKDTYIKMPKLNNIIELKGYYHYGQTGNRMMKRFRFRNLDNMTKMERAIADTLPLVPEQSEIFDNDVNE
jgi:hypothetical protein